MRAPVLAAWASVVLLLFGGTVGAVTVDTARGGVAPDPITPAPTAGPALLDAAPPSPTTAVPKPTRTAAPAATPAGWMVVRGDGWRISLPARPEVRTVRTSPGTEYRTLFNHSIERSADGGMSLLVFDYLERPQPGRMAEAMIAYVSVAEGTMGPIGSADVGGRPGQTASMARKNGPGQVTAFLSGNDLFVLATRNTAVHTRILSTFAT